MCDEGVTACSPQLGWEAGEGDSWEAACSCDVHPGRGVALATRPLRARKSRRPPLSWRGVEPRSAGRKGPQGAGLDGRPFSLSHGANRKPRPARRARRGASHRTWPRKRHPFPSDGGTGATRVAADGSAPPTQREGEAEPCRRNWPAAAGSPLKRLPQGAVPTRGGFHQKIPAQMQAKKKRHAGACRFGNMR